MLKRIWLMIFIFLTMLTGCTLKKVDELVQYIPELPVVSIGVGRYSSWAIDAQSNVYLWGEVINSSGEWEQIFHPRKMYTLPQTKAIYATDEHYVALTNQGKVYTWGNNFAGALGNGSEDNSYALTPALVEALKNYTIIDVATSWSRTICLTDQGEVFVWGYISYYDPADESIHSFITPQKIPFERPVVDVAMGQQHSVALTDDGSVYTWGWNGSGQLGNGSQSAEWFPPTKVTGLPANICAIDAQTAHTYALTDDGILYTWGLDHLQFAQYNEGDGILVPTVVPGLENEQVIAIYTGRSMTVVRTADGQFYSWGNNDVGQLGEGTLFSRPSPVLISALQHVQIQSLAVCSGHVLALTDTGAIYAWGFNGVGQLGIGQSEILIYTTPVPVRVKEQN